MPNPLYLWPYAAKAVIQHELEVSVLKIWITFKLPMKICTNPLNNPAVFDVKPPDEKWLVKLDDVETAITSSDWLDMYTLQLTINSIFVTPAEVLVSYLGPDSKLITVWGKQWEAWSEIESTDINFTLWKTGMIIMWHGSIATIPTGWHLCDGSEGTPDLRNRFVICANADVSGIAKSTIIGTAQQSGGSTSHHHSINTQLYGTLDDGESILNSEPLGQYNISSTINAKFDTQTETTVNPFYALAYIMKL